MYKYLCLVGSLLLSLKASWGQVNLPTGKAEFNFPLYNYSDGNKLSTAISLNYAGGGGIKVDEVASNVGLGWELQYGGIISRTTIGEPDDQIGRDLVDYDAIGDGYYKHSYLFQCMPRAGWVPMFAGPVRFFKHDPETIADREEDIFSFHFGSEEGSFVIGKDGTIKSLKDTKLKIEKFEEDMIANHIVTRISKFIITTTTGVQYVFNDKSLNKIISYESAPPIQFYLDPPIANKSYFLARTNYRVNDYYVVDNWYLSEIINPLTGKKIIFNYDTYNLDYIAGQDAVQAIEKIDDTNYREVVQWVQTKFNGLVKRISNIKLPNGITVEFKYFDNDRADLPGDKALKQIVIKEDGIEKSGHAFTYQYFSKATLRDFNYAFPADEVANARLSLLAIQKTGKNNYLDKPYTFSYYIGDRSGSAGWIPPRMAASKDHFGYYNGILTYPYDNNLNIYKNLCNIFLPRFRVVHPALTAQNGALKTVKYPTGGTMEFEYDLNAAWVGGQVKTAGGVRVKKVTQSDAVDDSKKIVSEYKYVDEAGNPSGWGYEEPVYTDQATTFLVLPPSADYYAAHPAYVLIPNMVSNALSLAATRYAMRAKVSFGTSLKMNLLIAAVTYLVGKLFSPDLKTEGRTTDNSYSAHPKNQNPLPFLYKRVEVYSGSEADNIGKTIYEFTSDKDFPIAVPDYKEPYSSKQRYFSWAYGLLKRYKIFNKLNEPVKEEYNKYTARIVASNDNFFRSVKCVPSTTLVSPLSNFDAYANKIFFSTEGYYPLTGRIELDYTVEKNYSNSNDYIMQRTDYVYDPAYYDVKKIIQANSLGETIERRLYYPYDYNITGILTQMKDKNILNIPISTETWIIKSGSEDKLLNADIREYQQVTDGDYKPAKVYRLNTNTPVSKSVIGEFDPTKLNRNASFLKLEETLTYNNTGEIGQTLTHGRIESNIYDDNSEVVIAKSINAVESNIAYSSFEEKATGTWKMATASGTSLIVNDATAPTGKRCLKLADASALSRSGLDAGKEYIVSYWYKGGSVAVSGGVISRETGGQTVNGWVFKTMRVKQVTTLSVTGNAYIDELRLHPVDAKMITTCYDDLMNVSSITAADNTTVYYEYDEMGRQKQVKDAQRNIVGLYEYKDRQ